jgi:hypothetical protein
VTVKVNLREFSRTLAQRTSGSLHEEVMDPAMTLDVPTSSGYVWPDLAESEDSASQSSIALVTAPGAMGKSAAARSLAAATGAPLIDLAKVPIGGDSLTGLLTRVLGWEQAPDFVKNLRAGRATLILDSLDEAQLAAGQNHFVAFLRNIADLLKGGAENSQVVIFGRRDTVETATLALVDLEIQPRQLAVSALSFEQSCELIGLVLDDVHIDGRRHDAHRSHEVPFAQYRDSVLFDMAKALGSEADSCESSWPEVGDFLGYPPVLMVLARHLVVENPAAAAARARTERSTQSRGELLLEVTQEIMQRESGKVQSQMGPVLGIESTDPRRELLYNHDEQISRLVSFLLGQPLVVPVPSALTAEESATYQDQISAFVPDHPFLRGRAFENVVFEDYVRAYLVLADGLEVQGLRSKWHVTGGNVGPFFAHFLHAMGSELDGSSRRRADIPEHAVDAVIKSFAASTDLLTSFVYTARADDDFARLFLSEEPEEGATPRVLSAAEFRVTDLSGLLELSSPVSRGIIVVSNGAVSVSATSGEAVLGPDLVLLTGDFILEGKRLTVVNTPHAQNAPHGGVLLAAKGEVEHEHDLRINAHPPEILMVAIKNAWHQWHGYQVDNSAFPPELPPELGWQVMFGIRRLLMVFHKSTADDPSLYYERLDRFAVGSNPAFAATLEGLVELNVIVREGALYRLRLGVLSEYGVNYAALRGPDFQRTLAELYRATLKTAPLTELIAGWEK